jgi:hypothetical protein
MIMETTEKKKPPPPPPPTKPKPSWWIDKKYIAHCYRNSAGDCLVIPLWEVGGAFYDARLAHATKEIDDILGELNDDKDPNKELSFIKVENRLLLVWTETGTIGPDDNPDIIKQALGLKEEKLR